MSTEFIQITVNYRGSSFPLSLLPDDTLALLQARLEELTSVPPHLQKLLYKGKKANSQAETTIVDAGLKNGVKIQMLGTTSNELGDLQAAEAQKQKRDEILRERALKAPSKLRSTTKAPDSATLSFRFHSIRPLAHLPQPERAVELLERLAHDQAIVHVMRLHRFSVGVLSELAPHEHPHLLGLNENQGQRIRLRLRTEQYDGFRIYKDIRRVLCHELAHNVWGPHNNDFKELNSQLNREVAEFERAQRQGTHSLMGDVDVYEPATEDEVGRGHQRATTAEKRDVGAC
ncbi:WLM-domain-containing protein [Fistulina hepatica ATCC 64428]|uniref:WLM-domain-containing protein n=1 Tax=Fistulina hepatica ATCC 64428 TaxID=1128425 RepID=A0A0D7A851_9AGAR|nr:WLM-domain-containing protein [Fistulina hepatica ATCC 64428]